MAAQDIRRRVRETAERTLAEQHFVSPDRWQQGRVPDLEGVTQAGLGKITTAMTEFRRWAGERGLRPSETAYVARTLDRRPPTVALQRER